VRIVVGLGNPGKRYEATPHNVGYATVDVLAGRLRSALRRSFRFNSRMARAKVTGEDVLLVKPETYMNNSGMAVQRIMRYHRATLEDLIVVLDDADLELGRLRVKAKGSSGGHLGLSSVIEHVHGDGFARVRIGIGRREGAGNLVEHVLSPFSGEDKSAVNAAVQRAADAVLCVIEQGREAAMNSFNASVPQKSVG
jgi:peptidyl-tRNA hydrolase, PTH1 family